MQQQRQQKREDRIRKIIIKKKTTGCLVKKMKTRLAKSIIKNLEGINWRNEMN